LKNKTHYRIVIARIFTNGQTWDCVNTLLDRNGSDFQRRAQSSGSRVFGDFGDPKNAKRNTDKHRNTPKEVSGAGAERLDVCRAVTPGACLDFHRQACHRQAKLAIAALASLVGASGGTLNSYIPHGSCGLSALWYNRLLS